MTKWRTRRCGRRDLFALAWCVLVGWLALSEVAAAETPKAFYAAAGTRLVKIDTQTKAVLGEVQIPPHSNRDVVSDIAVSADNRLLYVVNDSSPTVVYDAQTLKLLGAHSIEDDSDLNGVDHLFVHPRFGSIWFAEPAGSWKQRIGVADPVSYKTIKTIVPDSQRTNKFLYNAFDGTVIAAGDDASVIDANTLEIVRMIDKKALGEKSAHHIDMTMHKSANQVIISARVSNYQPNGEWNSLYRFDLKQWTVLARERFMDKLIITNMLVNSSGTRLFARITIPEDGRAVSQFRRAVGVFDIETLKLVNQLDFPVHSAPYKLYDAPDGKGIWLAQGQPDAKQTDNERRWPVYRLDGDTGELIETLYFPFPLALLATPH